MDSLHRVLLTAGVLAVSTLPAGAQSVRQTLDTTIAFTDGVVDLRAVSGQITVATWAKKEARISAWIERGEIAAELSGDRIRLEAKSVRGRMGDHRFTLTVPVGTRIEAHAVSGDVSIRGIRGDVNVEVTSGDVRLEDLEGRINATTVSGDISGDKVGGTTTLETVSGGILVRDAAGSLTGETVSGDAIVDGRPTTLKLTTVSGSLTYRGKLDPKGRYALQAHSGEVTLALPADAKADVTTKTFSGELVSDFRVTIGGDGQSARRDRMRFTLGGGGATVDLESFSGTITLRKAGASSARED